jgi:cyanate permease
MGFIKDLTGSFDGGLLVIAGVSLIAGIATLCIHHDHELEQRPEVVPAQ